MEADGEHNIRGTANTVTDGQRLDQLEDMVRELYRHVVGNEYSEGETPGPSGNFSNASMGFGANTVDEEFAVENAIDEKSMAKNVVDALASKREVASDEKSVAKNAVAEESAAKNASDEESGVTGGKWIQGVSEPVHRRVALHRRVASWFRGVPGLVLLKNRQ